MAKLLSTSLRGSNYGTLPLDNGGTGLTSTGAAGNVLTSTGTAWISAPAPISLPTQTGNSGKYLTTDGTSASWVAGTGTGTLVLSTSPTLSTSIITDSATFSLINTVATTVNFAGAATSLSIGAGTGTTTINNELHVAGDIFFNGSVNKLNATNIELTDSLIYLSVNNPANIIDIGFIGAYTSASTHLHTGFFRDASDNNIWKLVSGLSVEPSTTVDLTGATYDTLQVGPLIAATVSATATAITQVPATFSGFSASHTADLFNVYTYTGGTKSVYVTAAGALKLATALSAADGGTGLTSVGTAGNILTSNGTAWVSQAAPISLPTQTGNSGKYLTTDGTNSSWVGGTGTGTLVLSTSPTLVTPVLGTPTSGDFSTGTFTWPTFNQNTTGTAAGLSVTLPVTSGGTGVTTSTGSGNVVLSTSPTLVSPILGTPTSGDLTNCTNAVGYSLKSGTTTISISTATAPTTGQVLTATSGTAASWQTLNSLPTQTGNASKYLTTDGTNASWAFFTGLTPTSVKTSSYTAQSNDLVRCNTTGGAFTVVFPGTPTDGTTIGVIDINETFGQYNLTLTPTNAFIEGDANGYVLDITGTYVSFIYNISTNNWRLLVTPTPSAAGTSQSASSKSMALSIIFGGI